MSEIPDSLEGQMAPEDLRGSSIVLEDVDFKAVGSGTKKGVGFIGPYMGTEILKIESNSEYRIGPDDGAERAFYIIKGSCFVKETGIPKEEPGNSQLLEQGSGFKVSQGATCVVKNESKDKSVKIICISTKMT